MSFGMDSIDFFHAREVRGIVHWHQASLCKLGLAALKINFQEFEGLRAKDFLELMALQEPHDSRPRNYCRLLVLIGLPSPSSGPPQFLSYDLPIQLEIGKIRTSRSL